jgi:hypothetical protein
MQNLLVQIRSEESRDATALASEARNNETSETHSAPSGKYKGTTTAGITANAREYGREISE